MIKLYNTLTKQKEILKTIEENKVRMYVCGPTVYNYIHIGNARPIIVFDVVRKYLEHSGYEVDFISNFTDVDDKIIKASNEEGISTSELTEKYITAFFKDYDALGCKRATKNPRVTEYMREIIDFISKLVEEGFAYEANGDVYFRTRKKEDYGKLSKQSIDDLISGARIEVGEHKEDPLDFALWKKAKPGEVKWDSPFGEGRPGWHIECSVMAKETLGETIDIHAGGQDLTFPHHENEIAQSECHNHAPFSNYWMHNAFINIDNKLPLLTCSTPKSLRISFITSSIKIKFLSTSISSPVARELFLNLFHLATTLGEPQSVILLLKLCISFIISCSVYLVALLV